MTEEETETLRQKTGNRVLYRGRPVWLTEEVRNGLLDEALRLRDAGVQIARQAHSPAGDVAWEFARSKALADLIWQNAGVRATPAGDANYLYYDQPGARIDPHIDGPEFPLQVLLMVNHRGYDDRRSALIVFPDGPKTPIPIELDSGYLVIFRASKIYHGRSAVSEGEKALLLGVGYAEVNAV